MILLPKTCQIIQRIHQEKNEFKKMIVGIVHLVGEELVSFIELLPELSFVNVVRLKIILANVSNFALTNGDFSVCSLSEFSCSELKDRPLYVRKIFMNFVS